MAAPARRTNSRISVISVPRRTIARLAEHLHRQNGLTLAADGSRMTSMGKRLLGLLAVALLASGCSKGGGVETSHGDGLVLLEVLSGSQVGDRLKITGLTGQHGEIDIPAPTLAVATQRPGQAIYTTGSGSVYLVDATRRMARRLDISAHAGVIFNPILFGQSEDFTVLASPKGDAAYLVDLGTGAVTNLIGLAGADHLFSAEFAPREKYLAFFGDKLVVVPTKNPKKARSLGAGRDVGFAGFTQDGTRIGSIDVSDPSRPKLIVQNVDGSGQTSVGLPPGTVRAHLIGRGDSAVIEGSDSLSIVDTSTGHVKELARFTGTPRLSWFGPRGTTALFGSGNAKSIAWDWLDLRDGTARRLPDLENAFPLLRSPADRYVFFADRQIPGDVGSLRVLDMASGQPREVLHFDGPRRVEGYQVAAGGRFALIPAERGNGGELRVVSAMGQVRVVASASRGLPLGTFSPNGDWVAVSEPPPPGHPPTVRAVSTADGTTRPLGQGIRPVWLLG